MPKKDKIASRPRLCCHVKVKHNSIDTISGKRKLSLHVLVSDEEGPIATGVNLNFSNMDDDKYERLLMSLGIDRFTEHTPLSLELFVPEGSLLTDWNNTVGMESEQVKDNNQTTLDEEDDEEGDDEEES